MTPKIKRLAVVVLAVLAVSAATASAAQALSWTATNGDYTTTVSGGQTAVFEYKAGPRTITCSTMTFEASLKAKEASLLGPPKFEKCKANGGLGAKFTVNNCDYEFTAPTLAGGQLQIECPFSEELEIHIYESEKAEAEGKKPLCTIEIAPQGPLGGITWSNEGIGNSTKVKGVFSGVKPKYTSSGNPTVCGAGGTGEILGTTTLSGKFGGTAEGVDLG
jgi:hypothetical protein